MSDDRTPPADEGHSRGDCPHLEAAIAHILQRQPRHGRRKITILASERGVPLDILEAATVELRSLGAVPFLDGTAVAALVKETRWGRYGETGERFLDALRQAARALG